MLRRAIFGGTFDPVHNAHLTVAREAADRFALDEVLFVAAASPPHKTTSTPFEHRFRMVELACAGEPRFLPSRIEANRERSYSILTIDELADAQPGAKLFFLIGGDAFAEIRTWRRWRDVIAAVEFIVASRPGHAYDIPDGARVQRLDTLALPSSSSEIRRRLARGADPVDVPEAVMRYAREHSLYRGTS